MFFDIVGYDFKSSQSPMFQLYLLSLPDRYINVTWYLFTFENFTVDFVVGFGNLRIPT